VPSVSLPLGAIAEPDPTVGPPEDRLRTAIAQHYEFVWRMLRRLGIAEGGVEDAAQQVLIVFSKRLADVRPGAERAFMIATATRVAADARKKRTRAREDMDPEALAALHSPAPLADELLDRARARVLLDAVLEAMPDELRAVFVLFEFEALTMAAIAELLELPAGTVASRLRRARATFELAAARYSQLRSPQ
jgi:RNA polymerase sigma-70 factor, ECF subfamily